MTIQHTTVQPLARSVPSQRPRRTTAGQVEAGHAERPLGAVRSHAGQREARTITVVIPAMNEERNIAWVLDRIPSYVTRSRRPLMACPKISSARPFE